MTESEKRAAVEAFFRKHKKGSTSLRISRANNKTIYDNIADACGMRFHDVIPILKRFQDKGYLVFPTTMDRNHVPMKGLLKVQFPPLPLKDHERNWREALKKSNLSETTQRSLWSNASKFKGMSETDIISVLEGLNNISQTDRSFPKYLASAEMLLGSSKLLDAVGKGVRNAFNIDIDCFKPSPKFIAVAGPPAPETVVLVENPNSLEAAVQAGASDQIAWICSYGFGLANEKSDQDGMLLESNLTTYKRHAVVLVREGDPPRKIEELLAHPRLYFWGDLDLSGIQIFDRLKRKLQENENASELQLSALYQPMLRALQDGRNHPYVPLIKGNQTECELHDEMAQRVNSLCRERAVDQEIVHEGFDELGMQPLSEAMIEEFFNE